MTSTHLAQPGRTAPVLLFIKNIKHYSRSTSTIAICGIGFIYEQTLNPSPTFTSALLSLLAPGPLEYKDEGTLCLNWTRQLTAGASITARKFGIHLNERRQKGKLKVIDVRTLYARE